MYPQTFNSSQGKELLRVGIQCPRNIITFLFILYLGVTERESSFEGKRDSSEEWGKSVQS